MPFPTLGVHDKDGADQTINTMPSAGQATMANSLPVVLASDQSALPVTDNAGSLTIDNAYLNLALTDLRDAIVGAGAAAKTLANLATLLAGGLPAALGAGGGLKVDGSGTAVPVSGTVATTAADGTNVAIGAVADAAVDGDAQGTVNAHLRGISKKLAASVAVTNADITTIAGAVAATHMQADVLTVPSAISGPGNPTVDSYSSAVVNLAASTANQALVAAPGANKQIWVYGLYMMADTAAGTVTLQDEDDTALSGTMAVSDEGGWVLPMSGNFAMPWVKVATNKALEADTGACTVDGIITYAVISV